MPFFSAEVASRPQWQISSYSQALIEEEVSITISAEDVVVSAGSLSPEPAVVMMKTAVGSPGLVVLHSVS
jgi:hypothetical protein